MAPVESLTLVRGFNLTKESRFPLPMALSSALDEIGFAYMVACLGTSQIQCLRGKPRKIATIPAVAIVLISVLTPSNCCIPRVILSLKSSFNATGVDASTNAGLSYYRYRRFLSVNIPFSHSIKAGEV